MRVSGPSSSSAAAGARRTGGKSSSSGFTAVEAGEEARGSAGLSGAAGVGSVAALLALQGADAGFDAATRAAKRAGGLLDLLDELKIALLEGQPLTGRLTALAARTQEARAATGDPRLETILDEVETRAAVELAKHAAA